METQNKTPVEIVQELIAIHTTRKEVVDKLKQIQVTGNVADKLQGIIKQSDQFISELMNELSNFGDAVPGEVNRENEYQVMWKNAFINVDTMNPQEGEQIFQALENSLKKMYHDILDKVSELPASLQEIVTKQEAKL
jgi:predicted RNase H-like nuclease (RuvC/YqgF family)